MDEDALGPVEGPLMRAKMHIRGGKRRLAQGKVSAGIVTLYDALTSAMEWYVAAEERRKGLDIREGDNLKNDWNLYEVLVRSGVLDGTLDFAELDKILRKALENMENGLKGCDWQRLLEKFEKAFTQIGVMPFDEASLPPEDPATF
jgi:hypothetical protein